MNAAARAIICIGAYVSVSLIHAAGTDAQSAAVISQTDRPPTHDADVAELIAFAELGPGQRIANFLPETPYFTQMFCSIVGANGRVYVVPAPGDSRSASADHSVDQSSPSPACSNIATIELRSRIYPAPELYSASDDPGDVYDYYASRLPVESFVAPEPLDRIFILHTYGALRTKALGSPNLRWVHHALRAALKPGGMLIVVDRVDPQRVIRDATGAGFEVGDVREAPAGSGQFLLRFHKPAQ